MNKIWKQDTQAPSSSHSYVLVEQVGMQRKSITDPYLYPVRNFNESRRSLNVPLADQEFEKTLADSECHYQPLGDTRTRLVPKKNVIRCSRTSQGDTSTCFAPLSYQYCAMALGINNTALTNYSVLFGVNDIYSTWMVILQLLIHQLAVSVLIGWSFST